MSISRCYRKHSPSVCEPQPFRKVTQISSTMIKGCTWLKFLNYQWWPHVLPKHVFPEGSRIFKQGKPQNPPSLGLPGGIQVEIRVVRSHLQIDPPGKFGSDPAGGGCHTITAAHKDISQQVLSLLLWGASTIGLQATQRNHGIIYLHPALKENKKNPSYAPVTALRLHFSAGAPPDLTCTLRGSCSSSTAACKWSTLTKGCEACPWGRLEWTNQAGLHGCGMMGNFLGFPTAGKPLHELLCSLLCKAMGTKESVPSLPY